MIATVTLNPSLDEWMRLSSLRVGCLNRATGFARYPGGKGLNVSRVIRELGGPACVALSGSLPPGAPPTTYHRWISTLRRLKIPATLDTAGLSMRRT